jgi:carbamate kinase
MRGPPPAPACFRGMRLWLAPGRPVFVLMAMKPGQAMRLVIALGGNALLRRGEPLTADTQRRNAQHAVAALAPLANEHQLVITHGNGPQVGLLAMQGSGNPLDVLDAETEGQIGYLLEQELRNRLPTRRCAALLTQVEVDACDPAFARPTKPIGPVYARDEAMRLARERGWSVAADGERWRRVVASPRPQRILELAVIELLLQQEVIVICAGGGGIPVVRCADGSHAGIEAVIDKDHASGLLARALKADCLLLLTDVDAVYRHFGLPQAEPIRQATTAELRKLAFAPGSMGPKIEAACEFVEATGGVAGIGRLEDAAAILRGDAGTRITPDR